MTKKPKNWEKSVDELLHDILSAHDKNDYGERAIGIDNLKQLIKSLSSQRTNEIIEEIGKYGDWTYNELNYYEGRGLEMLAFDMHSRGVATEQILKKLKHKYDQTN